LGRARPYLHDLRERQPGSLTAHVDEDGSLRRRPRALSRACPRPDVHRLDRDHDRDSPG
jgi:hypothetical protein